MSADNAIMILRFPKDDKYEYRIQHVQNQEDLYIYEDIKLPYPNVDYLMSYFRNPQAISSDADEAYKIAEKLYEAEAIVEYGITYDELDHPFEVYEKEAGNYFDFSVDSDTL